MRLYQGRPIKRGVAQMRTPMQHVALGRLAGLAVHAARAELRVVPAAAARDRRIRGPRPSASTPRRCRPCRRRRSGCATPDASRPRRGRTRAGRGRRSRRCSRRRAQARRRSGNVRRVGAARRALPFVLVAQPRARDAPGAIEPRGERDRVFVRHRGDRELRPVLLGAGRPVLVVQPLAGLGGVRPRRRRQREPPAPRTRSRSA